MALRDSLQRIMDDYEQLRRNEHGNPQAQAGMRDMMNDAQEAVEYVLSKEDPSVIGSSLAVKRHQGWNAFPCQAWIAVLNTNVTTSTERGFFPTYLIASYQRPPQVVLSLTSGFDGLITGIRNQNQAVQAVGARTTARVRQVYDVCDGNEVASRLLQVRIIRLEKRAPSDHCGYRAKLYEAAHICGIKYGDPLPSEEELVQDLIDMLKVYKVLVDSGRFADL